MSGDVSPKVKANQNLPNKSIPEHGENLITVALEKLKNFWKHENSLTGIQFYGDLEE
jgi:hypothetical protein